MTIRLLFLIFCIVWTGSFKARHSNESFVWEIKQHFDTRSMTFHLWAIVGIKIIIGTKFVINDIQTHSKKSLMFVYFQEKENIDYLGHTYIYHPFTRLENRVRQVHHWIYILRHLQLSRFQTMALVTNLTKWP